MTPTCSRMSVDPAVRLPRTTRPRSGPRSGDAGRRRAEPHPRDRRPPRRPLRQARPGHPTCRPRPSRPRIRLCDRVQGPRPDGRHRRGNQAGRTGPGPAVEERPPAAPPREGVLPGPPRRPMHRSGPLPHHRRTEGWMNDLELIAKDLYEEYYRTLPRDRQRSQWVMTQDTWDHLCRLEADHFSPEILQILGEPKWLIGVPVEIREGVEGIHLEREPSSFACSRGPNAGAVPGWHEWGCPHVDWTKA